MQIWRRIPSGTATAPGTFTFTVTATLASCAVSQTYTVAIVCPTLTLSGIPATTPVGQLLNATLSVTPAGSYSFNLVGGNLPPGLMLDLNSATLSGDHTAEPATAAFTLS